MAHFDPGRYMVKIVIFILIVIHASLAIENTVLVSGLKHPDVVEFSARYNMKLREVWGVDSDITLVSQKDVDQINYKFPEDGAGPNAVTRKYLKRLSIDSGVVAVLQLQDFSINTRRKPGIFGAFSGEAYGILSIRFSYFDLTTGNEIQTFVVETSADKRLGMALRSVDKTVNMSAVDRDEIIKELINKSIKKSYRNFRNMITIWSSGSEDSGVKVESDSDTTQTN